MTEKQTMPGALGSLQQATDCLLSAIEKIERLPIESAADYQQARGMLYSARQIARAAVVQSGRILLEGLQEVEPCASRS